MKITTLVENTTISKEYKSVHGLSQYIETKKHKLLFDLGPGKLFYENAKKMNINLEDIDIVVISHGHSDHGGALKLFLEKNRKAKIYISKYAFEPYYYSTLGIKFYVGLDKTLKDNDRFVFTEDSYVIDDELQLFSNIIEHEGLPSADNRLYHKIGKRYIKDAFEHEQNLLIHENSTYTLFAACSHNGIVNILKKAEKITGTDIQTAIGGFHIYHLSVKEAENLKYLHELALTLKKRPTKFYTCHCTGKKSFDILHKEMGEQMDYTSTGNVIEL